MPVTPPTILVERGALVRLETLIGTHATKLAASAAAGATTLTVYDATGYANGDTLVVGPYTDPQEILTVSSVSGRVITVGSALAYAHAIGSEVWELTDPTLLSLAVENAAGTETSYTWAGATVTRDGVGQFHRDHDVPDAAASQGDWKWRYLGTGTAQGAARGTFRVPESDLG